MSIFKKTCLLTVLFAICVYSEGYSKQSEQPIRKLQFEISQSTKWHYKNPELYDPKPQYVAIASIKYATTEIGSRSNALAAMFNGFISKEQQQFNDKYYYITGILPPDIKYPKDGMPICVHGVTEKDTKTMVELLINWEDEKSHMKLENAKNALEELRKNKSELEQKIPELAKESNDLAIELQGLKQITQYQKLEDAQESIREFNKILQLVNIEIVGVKAKLDMIKQQSEKIQKEENKYSEDSANHLFQMRLTQEIELAGALSRKKAAQSALSTASKFVTITEKSEKTTKTLKEKQNMLSCIPDSIAMRERQLTDMKSTEFQLMDNTIMIYPVVFDYSDSH